MSTYDRSQFFYDHAGYSAPIGATREQREHAHRDCAEELARAERVGEARGWHVVLEDDPDGRENWEPADDDEELLCLIVLIADESDQFIESLGAVEVHSEDDPHIRVVAAELMADLLASHRACGARVTCGGCGHAWCEACDPAPSALCHWCHGRGESTAEMTPTYEEMS